MHREWVPLSASSLVTGAMALVLGSLLGPSSKTRDAAATLQVVMQHGSRWMAMAVLFFIASAALTLGLPTILALFDLPKGRLLGLAGTAVFLVGTVGTCGYSMLMTFFHALVVHRAVNARLLDSVDNGGWLGVFLYLWIAGFMVGLVLIALGLFRARTAPLWVPVLMLVFVALTPVSGQLGKVVQLLQLMALALALTGVAVAATSPKGSREVHLTSTDAARSGVSR